MAEDSNESWAAATWQGSRRTQLQRNLQLTPRQRLEAMLALSATAEHLTRAQRHSAGAGSGRGSDSGVAESRGHYEYPDGVHEIPLPGCTPTPLASYLKALGVLRLVAEQLDPDVRGFWRDDQFILATRLDRDALSQYFLHAYRPTPVLAPWNGGSGFHPKDNRSGIDPIEQGNAERFVPFRDAIATTRAILQRQGIAQKPEGAAKTALLASLRNELGEEALDWLDAAVVLTEENPKYPPLLGTGGNDGRLDFTNNFMQHLVGLFDAGSGQPLAGAGAWIEEALFATPIPGLESASVGQFSPGEAGGPNQASSYSGSALFNSWDFVLMLEGALLFAAATTRRLEGVAPGALSYPFTVRPTGAGSGGAALGDEDNARAELWAPLWSAPTGLAELKSLLAEGRATIGRRPARDGLDFARAVSRLGVDRGISGFQRYAFLMRSGKAFFATPLNRIKARRNPAVDLIDDLDKSHWLSSFRRLARDKHASNRVTSIARRLEDALFELTTARYPGAPIERVLVVLGEAQRYLARSPAARDKCRRPVPSLSSQWLSRLQAEDDSVEIELAAVLAGMHGVAARPGHEQHGDWTMPMRTHLAPETGGRYPAWSQASGHHVTWVQATLEDNLAATTQRRLLSAGQAGLEDKPFAASRVASLAAVAEWLAGSIDRERLGALLPGLMLVRILRGGHPRRDRPLPLPAAYRVLKPFFCTDKQLREARLLAEDQTLELPSRLVRRLAADDIDRAVETALHRLRARGLRLEWRHLEAGIGDGRRLLAALLVPISTGDLKHLVYRLQPRRDNDRNTDNESA